MFIARTAYRLRNISTMPSLPKQRLPPIELPPEMTVQLTPAEDQICHLFDNCTKRLKADKGIDTECRIAGGWVRDKLLGSDCNDIDIALSEMMGTTFADHFKEFAQSKGVPTGTISKIAQNPEQSKHLETATFKFMGLDIDLVNLRSEEYANSSRIPTGIKFGTPLEDALRRDTTINSLFYNLHTRNVEDHTGKGLDDLKNRIIRTPLSPRETFLDDPLRVLRCIRFASRLGFEIVPEIAEAVKDSEIKEALVQKVARERAGEEISKMMKGRDPLYAIQLIDEYSLYDSIFLALPQELVSSFSEQIAPHHTALTAASLLSMLIRPTSDSSLPALHPTLLSRLSADKTTLPRLYLAAALTPLKDVTYLDKKKKTQSGVELALRESLKLGTQNHFLDGIPALFVASRLFKNPVLNEERFQKPSERVAIGLLLRDKAVHNVNTGSHWTTSLLFSVVQELVPLYDVAKDNLDESIASDVLKRYNTFVNRIEELHLGETVEARPLLDGKEVMQTLGATRPGPWTGKVMSKLLEWQLDHPEASKDDAKKWLQKQQDEGVLGSILGPAEKKTKVK